MIKKRLNKAFFALMIATQLMHITSCNTAGEVETGSVTESGESGMVSSETLQYIGTRIFDAKESSSSDSEATANIKNELDALVSEGYITGYDIDYPNKISLELPDGTTSAIKLKPFDPFHN